MKVFLDTNVLVSAFATRGLCSEVFRAVLAEHELLATDLVLEELRTCLHERIKVDAESLKSVVALMKPFARTGSATSKGKYGLRDSADAILINDAAHLGADVFVTGDKEIFGAAPRLPVRVLSPRAFWEMLREGV